MSATSFRRANVFSATARGWWPVSVMNDDGAMLPHILNESVDDRSIGDGGAV